MDPKTVLYAALGAPVAAAKVVNGRLEELRSRLDERGETLSEVAVHQLEAWAAEGEELLGRVSDGKMVDDLASRVDFDQARQQVTRLRGQLEDMLAKWRVSPSPDTADAPEADLDAGAPGDPPAGEDTHTSDREAGEDQAPPQP